MASLVLIAGVGALVPASADAEASEVTPPDLPAANHPSPAPVFPAATTSPAPSMPSQSSTDGPPALALAAVSSSCTLREVAHPHTYGPSNDPGTFGNPSYLSQDPLWVPALPATSPPAREGAVLAYDHNDHTVLFGGFVRDSTGTCVLGDTWTWDGKEWTQRHPANSPPARYGHVMAYDGSGVTLFGGYDGSRDLADTWTWDGDNWVQRGGFQEAPSARARAAMAYDPRHRQAVLFGGDHGGAVLGDTWVWDGESWTLRTPAASPRARGYAAMAYNRAADELVLHSGWNSHALQDTWGWDGASWTLRTVNSLRRNHSGAMAYHPATGYTVMQAGGGPVGKLEERPQNGSDGVWDGSGWASSGTNIDVLGFIGPSARSFPAMAEDGLGQVVFFGGYTSAGDQADTWTLITPGLVTPPSVTREPEVTVSLDQAEISPDGATKVTATASVRNAGTGVKGYHITFSTDGDVTFSQSKGDTDDEGRFSTEITASKTPGLETITISAEQPLSWGAATPNKHASTVLIERGMTLTLVPDSISPDGHSTSVATATVYKLGDLKAEAVCFATDGDVAFSAPGPGHCGERQDRSWTTTIRASLTPGLETITATALDSGFSASAVLDEGGGMWFDRTAGGGAPGPARENPAIAYDESSGLTVLFGGYDATASRTLGDTWVWDAKAWRKLTRLNGTPIPGPSAREGAAMAYDATSGKVILFGGHDGTNYLGDTWSFDGTARTWTQLHPDVAPLPRYVANMAPDGTGVVLFSGTGGWAATPDGPSDPYGPGHLADTWTWRNGAWIQQHPERVPPPPPAPQVAEFSNPAPVVTPLPGPPPGCPAIRCPADKASPYPSEIAVSGLAGTVSDVTVSLHGLTHIHFGPADLDIMVVAPDGRSLVVMSDACGTDDRPNPIRTPVDLSFDDQAPFGLPTATGCASGTYRPTNLQTPYECTPFHDPDAFGAPAPDTTSANSLASFRGTDPNGTWRLYVVDDCPNDTNPLGEAGRIAGGWSLQVSTGDEELRPPVAAAQPTGRGRAAMAYHPPTGKVVMHGGTQEFQLNLRSGVGPPDTSGQPFNPLGDTWSWDGTRWTQEGAGEHPSIRRSAAMAYDSHSGSLVLFGGSATRFGRVADPSGCPRPSSQSFYEYFCRPNDDTPVADTWTWDGQGWARQDTRIAPPARIGVAAPDSRGRVVVVSASVTGASTWLWDAKVSLRITPGSVAADGASTLSAVATVKDSAGRPVAGLSGVSFTSGGELRFSAAADRGDGTYVATATATTTPGIEVITVHTPWGVASANVEQVGAACAGSQARGQPGTWSAVPPMPTPRLHLAATTGGDGRIYAVGGIPRLVFSTGDTLATVEAYSPCTNSWQSLPSLPRGPRTNAVAAAGPDGRVYVVGGYPDWGPITNTVEVYTPASGSTPGRWETLPPMPTPRARATATFGHDGKLYVTGGWWPHGTGLDTTIVFSPETRTWTAPGKAMSTSRAMHGAATTADGRILTAGGQAGSYPNYAFLSSADAYDPATDSWTPIAPMSNVRRLFGIATGPDGLVYAPGGGAEGVASSSSRALGSVEAYSDCANAWVPVTPLAYARGDHAVVTGSDGRIYVLGGQISDKPLDSVGSVGTFGGSVDVPVTTATVEAYTVDPETNPCPTASIDDVTVSEDPAGAVAARFTVSLDHPSSAPLAVNYQTVDGSAAASSDYAPVSGVVTFAPGETSKTIEVAVHGDAVAEATEQFAVVLSVPPDRTPEAPPAPQPPLGLGLADLLAMAPAPPLTRVPVPLLGKAEGIGTILDAGPGITVADVVMREPPAGSAPARVEVALSEAPLEPVSVHYATSDGSAVAGVDYLPAFGDVVFFPGEATTKSFEVTILADAVVEPDETFGVQLTQPSGGVIIDGEATGTIVDTPPVVPAALPTLRVDDVRIPEPSAGTVPATFNVALSQAPAAPVTVRYATADGSATAADYEATSGILEFGPGGPLSLPVQVPVRSDDVSPEPDETFTLALTEPAGATLARPQAVATIIDTVPDRLPVHTYECAAAIDITPNSATLRATTSDPGVAGATFNLSRDATPVRGPITAPGSGSFSAGVSGLEPASAYTYTASFDPGAHAQTNAPCAFSTAPAAPVPAKISVADARRAEPADAGTEAPMTFAVSLDAASSLPVVVRFDTIQDADATDGVDYVGRSGDVFFAPGDLTETVAVAIRGDDEVEPEETFSLRLSDPLNATIADADATGAIVDTPPAKSLAVLDVSNDVTVAEPHEGATAAAAFTVSLSKPADAPVSVTYATADAGATAGADYTARIGTMTFGPGQPLTQTITVQVLADDVSPEDPQDFTFTLANPTGADLGRAGAIATITDTPPVLAVVDVFGPASVVEPKVGSVMVRFDLRLNKAPTAAVSVPFFTTDGSAGAPDYLAEAGEVVFGPGEVLKTVDVAVLADSVSPETPESFHLDLGDPTGATVGQDRATVFIEDNPPDRGAYTYDCVAPNAVGEHSATLHATTTDPGITTATFSVATAGGAPVGSFGPSSGPGLSALATDLTPDTDYVFTATFGPNERAQDGAPCPFRTAKADEQQDNDNDGGGEDRGGNNVTNNGSGPIAILPPPPPPPPPAPIAQSFTQTQPVNQTQSQSQTQSQAQSQAQTQTQTQTQAQAQTAAATASAPAAQAQAGAQTGAVGEKQKEREARVAHANESASEPYMASARRSTGAPAGALGALAGALALAAGAVFGRRHESKLAPQRVTSRQPTSGSRRRRRQR